MHEGRSAFSNSAVGCDKHKSCTPVADGESSVPSAATISAASEGGPDTGLLLARPTSDTFGSGVVPILAAAVCCKRF